MIYYLFQGIVKKFVLFNFEPYHQLTIWQWTFSQYFTELKLLDIEKEIYGSNHFFGFVKGVIQDTNKVCMMIHK